MSEKISSSWHELVPAYGRVRTIKTQKEAREYFLSGKDVEGDITLGFKLCSVRNFASGTKQLIRYRANTQVVSVEVPKEVSDGH